MKHTIRKYCYECEEQVKLNKGCCPKCDDFIWDPSDTPDEFTYEIGSSSNFSLNENFFLLKAAKLLFFDP